MTGDWDFGSGFDTDPQAAPVPPAPRRGLSGRERVLVAVAAVLAASTATLAVLLVLSAGGTPAAEPVQTAEPSVVLDLPAAGAERTDYDRDAFGQAWLDVDRNGCDTRNDILGRDLESPVFKAGTGQCKVLSGTLHDPYTGAVIPFVSGQTTSDEVQIDHIVPLSWAWRNGAYAWTMDERERFANDPDNLLAVDGAQNSAKSDSGPAGWLPADTDYWCTYVRKYVALVESYSLTIDDADRAMAVGVLAGC